MQNRVSLFLVFFLINTVFVFAQTTPKVTVTPAEQNINIGQNVTVRIVTENVDKCTITGEPYNNFDIIKSGSILLRPNKTTTYTFNCKNTEGVTVSTKAKVNIVSVNNSTINTGQNSNTSNNTSNSGINSILNNLTNIQQNSNTQNTISNTIPRNNTQYSNQNLQVKANELCARYSGSKEVYVPPTVGGGSTVPTSLPTLEAIMKSIERYTALTGNELRQQNLLKYCEEYKNLATASQRLGETAAKNINKIQQDCTADERCLRSRVQKEALSQEIKYACQTDRPYKVAICELVQKINQPKSLSNAEQQNKMINYCNDYYDNKNFFPKECLMIPKANETIVDAVYAARDNIESKLSDIKFSSNGVMGTRTCTKTASNRPPEEVEFYKADCLEYRQEPSIINEEILKQITALPYTQAFSPSAVLGYDGILDNINTRTREGNLFDGNVSPTFGSNNAGNNPVNSGASSSLLAVEANYKQIATNIGSIVRLYDVAKLAYASSSSICKPIPVLTRREVITRIDTNKKTYLDYIAGLKSKWDAAIAKPREDHSSLIVQVNFDLKDKYNQAEIDKVLESVKKLLQACVDAGGKAN